MAFTIAGESATITYTWQRFKVRQRSGKALQGKKDKSQGVTPLKVFGMQELEEGWLEVGFPT